MSLISLRAWRGAFAGKRFDRLLVGLGLLLVALPDRLLVPWSGDLARLATVPVLPVMHLGVSLRDAIRPPRAAFDPRAPEVVELEAEVERFRMLYEGSRIERERLERTIASLGAVSTRLGGGAHRLLEVSIVGVDPTREDGVLRINAGTRHGVTGGSPAFLDGDAFVGLVTSDVGPSGAGIVPSIRLPSIGVRLHDESMRGRAQESVAPGAMLRPTGRGTWEADVATAAELVPGMVARLADDRMPRTTLGARVGVVVSVRPVEQAPLARRVEVRPIVDYAEIDTVVVAVPEGNAP